MFVFYFTYSMFLYRFVYFSPAVYNCLLFLHKGVETPIAVNKKVKVNGKASNYRPGQAPRSPGG
jgi:hypothetical protein